MRIGGKPDCRAEPISDDSPFNLRGIGGFRNVRRQCHGMGTTQGTARRSDLEVLVEALGTGAVGGGLLLAGQPNRPKRFVMPGSAEATSLAEKVIPRGPRFPMRLPSPTRKRPSAKTVFPGRPLARWTPYIGAMMLAYDAGRFTKCMLECADGEHGCGENVVTQSP